MRLKPIYTHIAFLLATAPVYASSTNSDLFELPLEDLLNIDVLSPSQTIKKIGQAPNIISVVNAYQIEKMGARTLSDVLKMTPGVQILTRRNGQDMVWIRGIPSGRNSKVMLVIDGVPQREGLIGGWSPDEQVQLNNIERIEVIRGPGSALYGGDAYSGMVSIFTKQDVPQATKLSVGVGSYDRQWASFNTGKAGSYGKLILSGRWLDSEGYRQQYDRNGFDSTHRNNVDAKSLSASLINEQWQFGVNYDDYSTEYPHYSSNQYKSQRYQTLSAHLKHAWQFDKLSIENQLYTYRVKRTFERTIFDENNTLDFYSDSDLDTAANGLRSQWNYGFNNDHHAVFGLIYQQRQVGEYHETISLKNSLPTTEYESRIVRNGDYAPSSHNRAVYLQQESYFWQQSLGVTIGARIDDYPEFSSETSPRIAVTYQSSQDWSSKLIWGTAFRAPTFLQQYEVRNDNNVSGNPNLTPEKIETLEAEWVYHFSNNENVSLRGFSSDLSDFIQSVAGNPYDNSLEKQHVPGYEVEWNAKWQASWQYFNRISSSFNYTRVNSDQASLAKDTANWLLFAEDAQFSFYLGLNYLGRRNPSDTYHARVSVPELKEQNNKSSYWTLDSNLSYRPDGHSPWQWTIGVKNLLDKQHYNPTYAPDSYYDVRKEPFSIDVSVNYRFN
ncbi:ferrienterochelin and colicins outer membrane receptor [Pseudoalteromonas ulvae UL12]|uniref:TonB-dependent receptor plug domain-containing protein n=1 Tax=Pseudoalteromonas ulvae TaxID=107327 RepID=UPI00186B9815|nr:TonB-dependent receptor [Pseudoalteromonas ulvae]MBE0365749.1 ferrienterochelin and colicins outer membrane receptor [Pseudoalteromonas ulvae UL12]